MPTKSILEKIKKILPNQIIDTIKDIDTLKKFTNNFQNKTAMKIAGAYVTKSYMKKLKKYIDQYYIQKYKENQKILEMERKLKEQKEKALAKARKYPQSRVTSVPALRPVEPLAPTQKITIMPKPVQTITTKVPEPLGSGQVIKYPEPSYAQREQELKTLISKQPKYQYQPEQIFYIPNMIKTIRNPF